MRFKTKVSPVQFQRPTTQYLDCYIVLYCIAIFSYLKQIIVRFEISAVILAFLLLFFPKGEDQAYKQTSCSQGQGLTDAGLQNIRRFCIFLLLGICDSFGAGSGEHSRFTSPCRSLFLFLLPFTVRIFLSFQIVTLSLA